MNSRLSAHVRGDVFILDFTLGGGWLMAQFDELWFTVRLGYGATAATNDTSAIHQETLTGGGITSTGTNTGRVRINASETHTWEPGTYNFDLQGRVQGDSEQIYTISLGKLPVIADVTRSR